MPVLELCAPHRARIAPSLSWWGDGSAGRIDPTLDRAMAMSGVGAWACNLSNNELTWTSGVYDIFGLPAGKTPDRTQTVGMYTEDSRETMERLRKQAIASGGIFTLDAQVVRPNGDLRWVRISGEMIRTPGKMPILHGLKQDVTEEKLRSETLRRLAENDTLTGLASRAVYESRFLNRRGIGSPVVPLGALVLFDLDGFKGVNDRLGHSAGDACLKAFAERLAASFPDAMLTARIGGDEFALIVSDQDPIAAVERKVSKFLADLRAPIVWREHMFTVGATSGIAVPTDPYSYDPEELFNLADAALYSAKRARRRTEELTRSVEVDMPPSVSRRR